MSRINAIGNDQANPKAREMLAAAEKKLGMVPNLFATMANSPAVLEAYLGFSGALAKSAISARLREQIALVVGEANRCDYCLAAHAALGRLAGLSDEEIADSRTGNSPDSKAQAVLRFAQKLVRDRGFVSDDDVNALRKVGLGDPEISEVVAVVALNLFTNYFNHVAGTEVDFPKVAPVQAACAN